MPNNLEEAIAAAGSPVNLLWESQTPPAVVPRVVQEFRNWRDEQLAWRRTAVLFDQSHHMADLNIKGPDALKLIRDLAVNSVENFPVDMAKQFVAVNHDGYVIGDNILFHLDDDEYQAVGIPPSINWLHYHAVTGGYDVEIWRDDNSLIRQGDPVLYRYQVQGPGALDVGHVAGVQGDAGPLGDRLVGMHQRVHLEPLGHQPLGEIAAVLAADAGDQRPHHRLSRHFHPCRAAARSASTISATSSGNVTLGFQPSTSRALLASPMRVSTSAGRMKRGFWRT